jgi:hypothetical protein
MDAAHELIDRVRRHAGDGQMRLVRVLKNTLLLI